MKKLLTVLMAVVMLVSCMVAPVYAAEDSLQWTYLLEIHKTFDFDNNNTGYFSAGIDCVYEVTEIEATATLYYVTSRGNWSEVTSWYYSAEDYMLGFDVEFDAISGKEYVVQLDVTAYAGDDSESVTVYTLTQVCP